MDIFWYNAFIYSEIVGIDRFAPESRSVFITDLNVRLFRLPTI